MADFELGVGIRRLDFSTLARFCAVGVVSTLVFISASWALLWLSIMPAAAVNVLAMVVGIGVSYAGHYYFTYRKQSGRHVFFGSRFFFVTAILLFLTIVLTNIFVVHLEVSPYVVSVSVAVLYPFVSFLLHHFWTFAHGK